MSAPVDVLAVLDDLIADMGDTPGTTGHRVAQVRAAVAEMIEAAGEFSGLYGTLWDVAEPEGSGFLHPESVVKYDEAHERLHAALARVQGKAVQS